MGKTVKVLAAAVAVAHLAGCGTVGHTRNPGEPPLTVQAGDRVHLSSDPSRAYEVIRVSADEVCAPEKCFSQAEVSALYREEPDDAKVAKRILAVVVVVAVVALIAAATAGAGAAYGFPAMMR
jgi:hypothetical protein